MTATSEKATVRRIEKEGTPSFSLASPPTSLTRPSASPPRTRHLIILFSSRDIIPRSSSCHCRPEFLSLQDSLIISQLLPPWSTRVTCIDPVTVNSYLSFTIFFTLAEGRITLHRCLNDWCCRTKKSILSDSCRCCTTGKSSKSLQSLRKGFLSSLSCSLLCRVFYNTL